MSRVSTKGQPAVGKLVRDRIPEIIRRSGRTPSIRTLGPEEYSEALEAKLREEAAELAAAESEDARAEEIADVLEVLMALARVNGTSWADVERIAGQKRDERGGFLDRTFLEG